MNDSERTLLRYVCDGDIKKAKQQARVILSSISSKKDEQFRDNMLRKLDAKGNLIELPYNLRELLIVEDSSHFPEGRFLLRENEGEIVKETLAIFRAADKLTEMGIPYLPALMLYGESGCGKTMLARYTAHKAEMPFVNVQFSRLVNSLLGGTQSNVAKVFEYVRREPCVLCLDEIDAIGMARGQKDDVGEMNRVVIALMQELDKLPNNVIIIGTTNRFDRLDPALVRRFPLQYELTPLNYLEAVQLSKKFFTYAGVDCSDWIFDWGVEKFGKKYAPASSVVRECTNDIVARIMKEYETA